MGSGRLGDMALTAGNGARARAFQEQSQPDAQGSYANGAAPTLLSTLFNPWMLFSPVERASGLLCRCSCRHSSALPGALSPTSIF